MKNTKFIVICLCSVLNFGLISCDSNSENKQMVIESDSDTQYETDIVAEEFCVYIVGEVVNPGVYAIEENARVCDVVHMAGGFTEDAAKDYINLAKYVSDEEQIIVYSISQVESGEVTMESQNSRVNINTATKEELMTLPGIGESRASDIISFRQENGSFATIEDIMKVSGIKESAFSKIEDLITVR